MKIFTTFVSLLLYTTTLASNPDTFRGAWVNENAKWVRVRPDVNPDLQWAQAEILYFGASQKFGLIYCTVIKKPNKKMSISPGDPRGIHTGEWKVEGGVLGITYRLVEATILQTGQDLPGPVQSGLVEVVSSKVLKFAGKTFRRAPNLDGSADEAINGMRVSPK